MKICNMLQTSSYVCGKWDHQKFNAIVFAAILMKSSGLLHEAVRGLFSMFKHILSIFWSWKKLFSKHTGAEQKRHHAYKKRVYKMLTNFLPGFRNIFH